MMTRSNLLKPWYIPTSVNYLYTRSLGTIFFYFEAYKIASIVFFLNLKIFNPSILKFIKILESGLIEVFSRKIIFNNFQNFQFMWFICIWPHDFHIFSSDPQVCKVMNWLKNIIARVPSTDPISDISSPFSFPDAKVPDYRDCTFRCNVFLNQYH